MSGVITENRAGRQPVQCECAENLRSVTSKDHLRILCWDESNGRQVVNGEQARGADIAREYEYRNGLVAQDGSTKNRPGDAAGDDDRGEVEPRPSLRRRDRLCLLLLTETRCVVAAVMRWHRSERRRRRWRRRVR